MSDETDIPEGEGAERPEWRNFYGRRAGKTMRPSQKTYLSEDLASLTPRGISHDENPARETVDPATIFGNDNPVWLEVGFGGGEHLVHMAATYPGVNLIGCEPFINGVAMLLGKIRQAGVTNLAVYPGDARDVMDVLPEGCIDKAFLPPSPPPLRDARPPCAACTPDGEGGRVPRGDRHPRLHEAGPARSAQGRLRADRPFRRGLGRLDLDPLRAEGPARGACARLRHLPQALSARGLSRPLRLR